ncbi:MAG: hypothetical protein ABIC40_06885, partial [bacterium]
GNTGYRFAFPESEGSGDPPSDGIYVTKDSDGNLIFERWHPACFSPGLNKLGVRQMKIIKRYKGKK